MQRKQVGNMWRAGAATLLVFALSSCVDEKIVYRDGPNFTQPPAAAANFLGYSDETTKQTVCGNCHAGQQGRWAQAAHSDAFASLEGSGHMQGFCQGCHTVSALGNVATDAQVGWTSTEDDRYKDVQCESCHGPGLGHVTAASRGQMLASVDPDTSTKNGCGECHNGTHHPFVEEWSQGRHSTAYTRAYNAAGLRTSCAECHVGQAVLEHWGVIGNYAEKTGAASAATAVGVTCAVCHDPHGSEHDAQLRFSITAKDEAENLCMRCHHKRGGPDWTSTHGDEPHSPHGPLILGTAGWWPPGFAFDASESAHSSEKNPKLCAGCHVQNYAVNDQATQTFQVQVVGHRFLAIPCVDANGLPTPEQRDHTTGARLCQMSQVSFKSCAASGCHTQATARLAFETVEADLHTLASALQVMYDQAPASEKLPAAVNKVTVARGAHFNIGLAEGVGAAAHNPFLVKALLRASIVAMNVQYGIPKPVGFNLAPYETTIQRLR